MNEVTVELQKLN